MYVLILSAALFFDGYKAAASHHTVTHIPGFDSQQTCLDAGNAWLKQQREAKVRGTLRALCVRTDSAAQPDRR